MKLNQKQILTEVLSGKAFGFIIAMIVTYFILPHLPNETSYDAFIITLLYTTVATIRSWLVRNFFNAHFHK